MYWIYGVLGFVIGGMIAGGGRYYPLGAILGAVIGLLLARLTKLEQRVKQLESQAQSSQRSSLTVQTTETRRPVFEPQSHTASSAHSSDEGGLDEDRLDEDRPGPAWDDAPGPAVAVAPTGHQTEPAATTATVYPSILQKLIERATAWLTTGNIPVKVGVLISFIGVAFLLKFAIDQKLLSLPLEFRLLAVAAAGLALLVIGWRLREKTRVYALSLQGGGAGILFLTIFSALRLWQLLPASLAFVLLLVLTALTGALAVLQNSRSLAILGIVGGFLAPILTSTGQGNHIVLFGYYLILNGAILGIAWFRAWRELNLVGWVFTFLIGSLWGYQYYKPELLSSTMPFLLLYFLFYQAIAILYALRQAPDRIGLVDGTLVFGTPVISFALQAALVGDTEYGLAISAAVIAVFYALIAWWLARKKAEDLQLLVESYLALAVAFATIAIPLALDSRWTATAWALEGAALVWVGARQDRLLAKLAGTALIFFSGIAFLDHGWRHQAGLPFLNGNFLGGLLISLSAFFASRKLEPKPLMTFRASHHIASMALFAWAVLWWIGPGWAETSDRATGANRLAVFLLFLTVSTAAATWLCQARQWSRLRRTLLLFLPLVAILAAAYESDHRHFLLGTGWLAWPAAWACQLWVLRALDNGKEPLAALAHVLSLFLLTLMLALESSWWVGRVASADWALAAASAIPGLMALSVWRLGQRPSWPVPAHPMSYLAGSIVLLAGQVAVLLRLGMLQPGGPDSGRYIPLLNAFDLGLLFAMVIAVLSLTVIRKNQDAITNTGIKYSEFHHRGALLATFFILTTIALVRGVHQFATVPWTSDALFNSVIVQTSLSVYWGLLGFSAMIWAARRSLRLPWLVGAGLMALVVVKLFIIDLGNSATVARIISFIAIGVLLLVVGYFAPAPPRQKTD